MNMAHCTQPDHGKLDRIVTEARNAAGKHATHNPFTNLKTLLGKKD